MKVDRATTAGHAAGWIRRRILTGELPPGTPLREVALSRTLGISRNTIREAFHTLVHEGLVRHLVHRGAQVASLTKDDIVAIFAARRVVELAATDQLGGGAAAAAEALSKAADRFEWAAEQRDPILVVEEDMGFHAALVDRMGNPRLSEFHRKLLRELRLGFLLADRRRSDFPALGREHRGLVRLLARGDLVGFRKRLARHLDASERQLIEVLGARPGKGKTSRG